MKSLTICIYLATSFLGVSASCDTPSPAFLLPRFDGKDPALLTISKQILTKLKHSVVDNPKYDTTSFSMEVTSQQDTLLGIHHTAKIRSDLFDGGAYPVSNDTRYRIASMTKPFVVLGILQLQKAGHLSLDDPVSTLR